MIKIKNLFLLIAVISFFTLKLYSAENLQTAIRLFSENNFNSSLEYCNKAISENDKDKAEALILKILISDIFGDYQSSFVSTKEFIKIENELNPYMSALLLTSSFFLSNDYYDIDYFDFWESLSDNPNLNSSVKAWINELISMRSRLKYDYRKSKEYAKKIGAIKNWQIVGVFENISESGFDKNFGPLDHPEQNYKFLDKEGAEVYWYQKAKPSDDAWMDLMENFFVENTIIYAQTFISTEKPGIYQLRIGTSGSLKVWVNDNLMIKVPEERNNGIDTYICDIKLNNGNNRILLQIGSSVINRNNFQLRITDLDGKVFNNYESSSSYSPYAKETNFKTQLKPNFAEEFFKKKIENEPKNLISYLLLGKCLAYSEKLSEAIKYLLLAQNLAPNSSYILNELADIYYRQKDRTNQSLVVEKMRSIDKDFPISLIYEIEESFKNEKFDIADNKIKQLDKLMFDKTKVYRYKASILAFQKKIEQLVEIIDEAYNKYPLNYDVMNLKYFLEAKMKNRIESAISILRGFLDKRYNSNVFKELTDNYKTIGD